MTQESLTSHFVRLQDNPSFFSMRRVMHCFQISHSVFLKHQPFPSLPVSIPGEVALQWESAADPLTAAASRRQLAYPLSPGRPDLTARVCSGPGSFHIKLVQHTKQHILLSQGLLQGLSVPYRFPPTGLSATFVIS